MKEIKKKFERYSEEKEDQTKTEKWILSS